MRPEPHAGDLVYRLVRREPLILVFPNDHRLAARKAIRLREIKGAAGIDSVAARPL
jgi:LysR family transcriptional regulator, hca operon transcriptional activator